MPDKTCEERIGEQLQDRLDDLRGLFRREDYDEISEYPLSVEIERKVRIVLSTGGPHDEFVATLHDDGSISDVEYVFMDWFDGARTRVNDPIAEQFIDYFAQVL
jgi:hypothetical protein